MTHFIALTVSAMLFITDGPRPLSYYREYPSYAACSADLLAVGHDAVCIDQWHQSLAPETSPRPMPNPRRK